MAGHELLTPEAHRDLRVRTERGAALGDGVMSCLVVPDEFRQVQNDYPILFQLNQERDSFTAVALFGFEAGENLFLGDNGWDARALPLAMAIQPFLIGGSPNAAGDKQVHVDMSHPRIGGDGGVRLFDADGRPSPYLEAMIDRLGALDAGYQGSGAFLTALRRNGLLEPLTLEVTLDDGSTNRLVGFHVIDEERLQALDSATLGELHADGHLMPIFMALASLSNIGKLVARKNRGLRHG
ncbi:MAG: SapC family protein [Pseudomonadota bacterium]